MRTEEPSKGHTADEEKSKAKNIIKLSYLVGPPENFATSKYKSIQDAIDAAQSDSVIKIAQGLYRENLVIKNKSLKLEAKDMSSEVFIMGENGPTLTVDNKDKDSLVTLERIKFAHKGGALTKQDKEKEKEKERSGKKTGTVKDPMKDAKDNKDKSETPKAGDDALAAPSNPQYQPGQSQSFMGASAPSMGKTTNQSTKGVTPKNNIEQYFNEVVYGLPTLDDDTNCVLLIKNGQVQLRNSKINMNMLVKTKQKFVPAIIGLNNSTLLISFCELRGSNLIDTVGLLMKNANLVMKVCTLTYFKKGAIALLMGENNSFKILDSRIYFNKVFGIQVIGKTGKILEESEFASYNPNILPREEDEKEIIKNCEIEKNDGPGIQICPPNTCLIKNNAINFNKNGIEIISADPRVVDNEICKNKLNGILVKSIERMYSIPIIQTNHIRSNRENGILLQGGLNLSKIKNNIEISYNKLCGIKIENQASPYIIMNKISKNIFQGILIVENAYAHIELNEISENIKANIAFGGDLSANTVITRNTITKGRCEGIFMLEAGTAYIRHNKISDNYDGIIMITSSPDVHNNTINNNKNSGVIIMKDSRPKLYNNTLEGNKNVGIFVRDNSKFWHSMEMPVSGLGSAKNKRRITDMKRAEELGLLKHTGESVMPKDEEKKELEKKDTEKREMEFFFIDNTVTKTPVSLVVERHESDGLQIKAMNKFDNECRIPYKFKDMKCTLI